MRQNQNPRRSRGRTNNGRSQGGKPAQDNNQQNRRGFSGSRQFESQGPDGKNRGTATQLFERYTALSREVISSDRTLAEAFSQFADHYYRVAAEAGQDASSASRDNAQANGEVSGNGVAREDGQGNNGNRNNVAALDVDSGTAINLGDGQTAQPNLSHPVVDGVAKEEGEGRWGNSRRRRAQNYREARNGADDVAPKPAHEPAPVTAQPEVPAAEAHAAIAVEVKPRRRLTRSTPKEDNAASAEATPAVAAEASEPEVAEVVKPRRGRPRKVVVTDESVA